MTIERKLVLAALKSGRIGKRASVPVEIVAPDDRYADIEELFKLYDAGKFDRAFRGTRYFKTKKDHHGDAGAAKLCRKAVSLLKHIRKQGYQPQTNQLRALPCIVVGSDGAVVRLDGFHRAAVLRYMGEKKIDVVEVTAEEAKSLV